MHGQRKLSGPGARTTIAYSVVTIGVPAFNMWCVESYAGIIVMTLTPAQSITRPLAEDEFKRVEYYAPRAKRIQELCSLFPDHFHGYVTYESSVLAAFAPRWTATKPLFPNLRILDVSPANDQYPVYYRFFHVLFGPQLQRISSNCTTFSGMAKHVPPIDYQQMLERLQESAPHLLHLNLSVDAPPYSPVIVSAMCNALCGFIHLVNVRIGAFPVTEQAFRYLAELPHLEVIGTQLPNTMTETSFRRTRFDEFFSNLREFRLSRGSSLGLISLVMQRVNSSQLEIIVASVVGESVFVSLDTVISLFAIFSVQNSERIQVLKIEASIKPTPESTLTAQHIESLFALQRLATRGSRRS